MMVKKIKNNKGEWKKENISQAYEYIFQYPVTFSEIDENISKKINCFAVPTKDIKAKRFLDFAEKFNLPETILIPQQFFKKKLRDYRKTGTMHITDLIYVPLVEGDNFYIMVIISDPTAGSREGTEPTYSFSRYIYPIEYDSNLKYCSSFAAACAVIMEGFLKTQPNGHGVMTSVKD